MQSWRLTLLLCVFLIGTAHAQEGGDADQQAKLIVEYTKSATAAQRREAIIGELRGLGSLSPELMLKVPEDQILRTRQTGPRWNRGLSWP